MASRSTLDQIKDIINVIDHGGPPHKSQGSLQSQEIDCIPIIRALGYDLLADYLSR
jgi:hypothetical protein